MISFRNQSWPHLLFYSVFGAISFGLLVYYLSTTILHFTTPHQFPVNSISRLPLTLLIFPAEIFSLLFAGYFVYALLTGRKREEPLRKLTQKPDVAVLIPVYNEPQEIVERTIRACKKLDYAGGVHIYILDDSTGKDYIKANREIAETLGGRIVDKGIIAHAGQDITIVRRKDRVGYKAGNINNALKYHVEEKYFCIFDSDQAPESNFLQETIDYFSDPTVGFVQSPQYYINDSTPLERAAKIGTDIFFQAQTVSKAQDGAMPFCGTNAIISTAVFKQVGGFSYYTATEDIDLGIRINDAGYRGVYVPKVLAKGYAPKDFKSYAIQQYRWANGNLAILREHIGRIFTSKKFSLRYQMHTFFTLGWWLVGVVSLIFISVPIISFLTGLGTHHTWLPDLAVIFLYFYVFMGIMMIYVSIHNRTNERVKVSDALLQYSLVTNSMFIYAKAAINALFRRYVGFVRTNKNGQFAGLRLIKWNLLLAAVCFGFSMYALFLGARAGDMISFRTFFPVSLWLLFYAVILASSILFVDIKFSAGGSRT